MKVTAKANKNRQKKFLMMKNENSRDNSVK